MWEVVPDFMSNMKLTKVMGTCDLSTPERSFTSRAEFDPRPEQVQSPRPLSSFDLDSLATITGGNCGILLYGRTPQESVPDVTYIEHHKVASTCSSAPLTIPEIVEKIETSENSDQHFTDFIHYSTLDSSQLDYIERSTRDQATSYQWKAYRQGRVTASKVYSVMKHVDEDANIVGKLTSLVSDVCGYTPDFTSAATEWGRKREAAAVQAFKKSAKNQHKNLTVSDAGFFISQDTPFIGASPDIIVHCACHGKGALEVKNPWTNRFTTVTDIGKQGENGLSHENGKITMIHNHTYYGQIQCQMYCAGVDHGFFAVYTAADLDNIHIELVKRDTIFIEKMVLKAKVFFTTVILRELRVRDIQSSIFTKNVKWVLDKMVDQISEKFADVPLFICPTCSKVCPDEPECDSERSLSCSSCASWYHWACVNVDKTHKAVLAKRAKWHCNTCKPEKKTSKV